MVCCRAGSGNRKQNGQIPFLVITWSIDDVQTVRNDLTNEQCMQVLAEICSCFDPSIGVNWQVLEVYAEELFPTRNKQ